MLPTSQQSLEKQDLAGFETMKAYKREDPGRKGKKEDSFLHNRPNVSHRIPHSTSGTISKLAAYGSSLFVMVRRRYGGQRLELRDERCF
jgi:hypothetical protein